MQIDDTKLNGRAAWRIHNSALSVAMLKDGGQIAEIRTVGRGPGDLNLLWEANWPTIDPSTYEGGRDEAFYGGAVVAPFLASYTGHALAFETFGMPSEVEAKSGVPLHGEASTSKWKEAERHVSSDRLRFSASTRLMHSDLTMHREMTLAPGEPVVYVEETVTNPHDREMQCSWVEHATMGAPLLRQGESRLYLSGTQARTWGLGYENHCSLLDSTDFKWPLAPAQDGGVVDLSSPFNQPETGFVVAVRVQHPTGIGYVAAVNFHLRMLFAYCFPIAQFPWLAIWEENRARKYSPWNGLTQARGVEFGSSPFPIGTQELMQLGQVFGVPTLCTLPARNQTRKQYLAFACTLPDGWNDISDISAQPGRIVVRNSEGSALDIAASALHNASTFLSRSRE